MGQPLRRQQYYFSSNSNNPTKRNRRGFPWYLGLATLGVGGIATTLYYTSEDARHLFTALQRCGTAGVIGSKVAYNYKVLLSKEYVSDEAYQLAKRECDKRSAETVLKGLQSLGGIYIKLGQHVSAMVYILPPEWTDTMSVLQDRCDPTPEEQVRQLFISDYGEAIEDIFDEFDWTPIGVASLAQVHKAKLKNSGGRQVAVKLQHPVLDEFCRVDMETVSFIIDVIKKAFPEFGFAWLADEMRESLPRELDFVHEAQNSKLVGQNFADDIKHRRTSLLVPEVIWAKRRILCMEFIEGSRIDDLEYMKQHGINPAQVSAEFTEAFSKMIFLHGFVHCDPHPGNVIIRPAKDPKHSKYNFDIVLIDHGLYRTLPEQLRIDYAQLWTSLIRGDEDGIRKYAKRVGGTDTYQLFASILTGRAWETVSSANLSTVRSSAEIKRMSAGAMEYLVDIADILSRLPRIALLLLKTSDLLRHIDEVLRTPSSSSAAVSQDDHLTYVIMGRYCAKAVWLDTRRHLLNKLSQIGFNWQVLKALATSWWHYYSLAVMLWLYQRASRLATAKQQVEQQTKKIEQ
ncbi:ABC1 family-domain-containing protein [Zychaea mexicana]|uniref:ABC1 family-domain-containing protein n=1 Tax=Zychaea mexicana TaxID=64656 RepID=UPI0022FE5F6D|nr:ABC1 family-domain-containing protein [Zychaea mexicana]KAI9468664.1 ABC1 family-domain-containing protein [Zychaea mexicana]